jgi:hypothetical protein
MKTPPVVLLGGVITKKLLTKQKNGYIIGAIKSMACHEMTSPIVSFTMGKLLYGGSSNEARYDFH